MTAIWQLHEFPLNAEGQTYINGPIQGIVLAAQQKATKNGRAYWLCKLEDPTAPGWTIPAQLYGQVWPSVGATIQLSGMGIRLDEYKGTRQLVCSEKTEFLDLGGGVQTPPAPAPAPAGPPAAPRQPPPPPTKGRPSPAPAGPPAPAQHGHQGHHEGAQIGNAISNAIRAAGPKGDLNPDAYMATVQDLAIRILALSDALNKGTIPAPVPVNPVAQHVPHQKVMPIVQEVQQAEVDEDEDVPF